MKLTSRSSSRALARKSVSEPMTNCDVTTAVVHQNDLTISSLTSVANCFRRTRNIDHFKIQHRFRNPPVLLRYSRHKVARLFGLRKCKRPTSDTDRYTELLKGDQIGKIPTYMEKTHVLLHSPIIIIHFS